MASGPLDPFPWDGDGVMEAVAESGGTVAVVSDEEILWAVKALTRFEGIFAEPPRVAGLAGLRNFSKRAS